MRSAKGLKAPTATADKSGSPPPIMEQIARSLGFETLEARNSDRLDFREIPVWEIGRALGEAYQSGYEVAAQTM